MNAEYFTDLEPMVGTPVSILVFSHVQAKSNQPVMGVDRKREERESPARTLRSVFSISNTLDSWFVQCL